MKTTKNIIAMSIVLTLILSLCGCAFLNITRKNTATNKADIFSNIESSTHTENSEANESNTSYENNKTNKNSKPSTSSAANEHTYQEESSSNTTVNSPIIIKTEYFNVKLPGTWEGKYIQEKYYSNENYLEYSISFYNKKNRDIGYGGHLFTIILTENSEYDSFACGGKIGELIADKTYFLFVRYPSDVQFDFQYMPEYNKMSEDIDSIIRSISPSKSNITIKIDY